MSSQKSMPVTIPATKAHRNFGELVRRVYSGQEHFIVERDGLPVAVLISMNEYDRFMKEREEREKRVQRFQENARAIGKEVERLGLTEEEVMAEVEKAKEEVYMQHYGKDR